LEPLIVIFLLFFSVLAFARFYVQRAKARPTTSLHPSLHAPTDRSSAAGA